MLRKSIALLVIAGALMAAPVLAGANLLTNGSFETPVVPAGTAYGHYNCYSGESTLSSWTISGSGWPYTAAIYGSESGCVAQNGSQFVQLGGTIKIAQTINLTVGQTYKFSFWLAPEPVWAGVGGVKVGWMSGADALVNEEQVLYNVAGYGNANPLWQEFSFTKTATDTSNTFSVEQSFWIPWVDNFSVEAVPEPGSLAAMLVGLAGFVGLRKRVK